MFIEDLDCKDIVKETIDNLDANFFTGDQFFSNQNIAVMDSILKRWNHQLNNIRKIVNIHFNFTHVYFNHYQYVVHICPEFMDTEAAHYPHGIPVAERYFNSKEAAENFAEEVNIILNDAFYKLMEGEAKDPIFVSTKHLIYDVYNFHLNPHIIPSDELIFTLVNVCCEKVNFEDFIIRQNTFFNDCFEAYKEEYKIKEKELEDE